MSITVVVVVMSVLAVVAVLVLTSVVVVVVAVVVVVVLTDMIRGVVTNIGLGVLEDVSVMTAFEFVMPGHPLEEFRC